MRTVSLLQKKLNPSKEVSLSRNTFKEVTLPREVLDVDLPKHLEEDVDNPDSYEQGDLGQGGLGDTLCTSTIWPEIKLYHQLGQNLVIDILDRYRSVIEVNSQ